MITVELCEDENLIALWYLLMQNCGRADEVFYSGPHDIRYVLDWAKNCKFWIAKNGNMCIGAAWISEFVNIGEIETPEIKAELGFGFINNCTIFQSMKAGRMILSDISEKFPLVKHLFGTTPKPNAHALAYAKRLGLKLVAETPSFCKYKGAVQSAITSYWSREDWNGRQRTKA